MIVLEFTDDKFGKAMKAISEIGKHSECLAAIFEDLAEDSEYGNRMGNRKQYDDDDMYGSRYGMRRGGRRSY
jgi:hypothetical protein